jgi:hypothetical protein
MGFREGLLAWQLKKQYPKRLFGEDYRTILSQIAALETEIALMKSQRFSSNEEE